MNSKAKALANKGAPSPFKMVGSGIKSALTKVASKVMEPTVKVMKAKDVKMEEMSRKAKAGEYNE